MAQRKQIKRNPEARELLTNPLFRKRIERSASEKQARDDTWSRVCKHKRKQDII